MTYSSLLNVCAKAGDYKLGHPKRVEQTRANYVKGSNMERRGTWPFLIIFAYVCIVGLEQS